MQLFLIRHAHAGAEPGAPDDAARRLTAHGRRQARALGERMRWHDCQPTHVWTSPLVRAVQTAELLAAGLHVEAEVAVEPVPALAPGGALRDVVAALRGLPGGAAVLVVGHEPALSELGAALAGEPGRVGLVTAEAARIVDGVVRWRFAWDADAPVCIRRA